MKQDEIIDPVRSLVNSLRRGKGLPPVEDDNETEREKRCPVCGGTGWEWLGYDRQLYSWVKSCNCSAVKNARQRIASSGLADLLATCTFDSFQTREPFQKEMARVCASYVERITSKDIEHKPWLYIGGQPGCGKTHVCTAVCGKLLEAGIDVSYFVWPSEARKLKALVNDPGFDAALLPFIGSSVLYIDDLFKQGPGATPSEADIRIAFEILNARYNQEKPTIISSERGINELIELDEGTISRLVQKARGFTLSIAADQNKNFRLK